MLCVDGNVVVYKRAVEPGRFQRSRPWGMQDFQCQPARLFTEGILRLVFQQDGYLEVNGYYFYTLPLLSRERPTQLFNFKCL